MFAPCLESAKCLSPCGLRRRTHKYRCLQTLLLPSIVSACSDHGTQVSSRLLAAGFTSTRELLASSASKVSFLFSTKIIPLVGSRSSLARTVDLMNYRCPRRTWITSRSGRSVHCGLHPIDWFACMQAIWFSGTVALCIATHLPQ